MGINVLRALATVWLCGPHTSSEKTVPCSIKWFPALLPRIRNVNHLFSRGRERLPFSSSIEFSVYLGYWCQDSLMKENEKETLGQPRAGYSRRTETNVAPNITTENARMPTALDERLLTRGSGDYFSQVPEADLALNDVLETETIKVFRSWYSQKKQLLFFLLLSLISVYGSWSLPITVPDFCIPRLFGNGLCLYIPILLIPSAIILSRMLIQVYDSYMEFDRTHMRIVSGVISSSRKQVEIPFESILFVQVDQGVFERLSDLGTISVGRNSHEKSEIVMKGVKHPYLFTRIIKDRMGECRRNGTQRNGNVSFD